MFRKEIRGREHRPRCLRKRLEHRKRFRKWIREKAKTKRLEKDNMG